MKMTFKNYILITLVVIAIMFLLCECNNIKELLITKIISLFYLSIFIKANINTINKQAN